ncbi:MAG: hypothetical protein M0P73_03950, partial [Syntrophobacterales bacterium]|nr:hypothetical protein [Syntrophobacterales bacterium]
RLGFGIVIPLTFSRKGITPMQIPNRTLLPKSPFFKGGLLEQFLVVPPFDKGGVGGILVF